MKRIYVVAVEWQLAGKGETPNLSTLTVIAPTADTASKAAVENLKSGFVEKLKYVRAESISRGDVVDLIV